MKICNIGSLNIDYVYDVDHFVQPGETLSSQQMTVNVGGKGLNQTVALARAGAKVFHAGQIGNEGQFLKDFLQENGADTSMVRVCPSSSGHAIIQVDSSGQNCILLFGGANQMLSEAFVDETLSMFDKGDILLLQNETNLLSYILQKAQERGLQIALNPSPYSEKLLDMPLENVRWFILNEVEGCGITGVSDPDQIVDALLSKYPEADIVLTMGEKGSIYANRSQKIYQSIFSVKVEDTTAAGDTFTGYLLAGLAKGMSPDLVLRYAAQAAAIAVSRKGAAISIPMMCEVEATLPHI